MPAPPLVSIIVRTYRGRGPLLKKALQSLTAQDYPALEVLVIEDGSSEHEVLVNDFNTSPRVQFKHFGVEKLGRSIAANHGLAMAKGKYIGFLDDDDVLYPQHCRMLAELLENEPLADASYAASSEIAADLNRNTMAFENAVEACVYYIPIASSGELLFRNLFPIQAVLFRRSILTKQNYFDPNLDALEDWLFWLRLLLGRKLVSTPEITSAYHVPLAKEMVEKRKKEHIAAEPYFETQRWALYEERRLHDPVAVLDHCKRGIAAAKEKVRAKLTRPARTPSNENGAAKGARSKLMQVLEYDKPPVLDASKADVVAFTSVNLAYLPKALVWAESLKKHHPDWEVHILLNDAYPTMGTRWPNVDKVYPINSLGIPNFQPWLFGMQVVEVCTATKSFYSGKLLEAGYKHVFYFDPDMRVYNKLDYLIQQFENHDVLITPHCTTNAITDAEMHFNEVSVLAHGIYNLGFAGFKNTENARQVTEFWSRRMLRHCRDDHARGLFTDQKWWNLVPVFFERVGILKHQGCNSASWNIAQRPITRDANGNYRAGSDDLLFFHFSGYDGNVPRRMFDVFGQFNSALESLIRDYDKRHTQLDAEFKPWKEEWALKRFDNGDLITDSMRSYFNSRYENELTYREPFFVDAPESFHKLARSMSDAHLRGDVPHGFLKRFY